MKQHKYERMDKGIKRPKRDKAELPLSIINRGALARINDDDLIDRIADGAYVTHLAREHGVTHTAMHLRLKGHPGYKEALKLRNAAKLDSHQEGIEAASDPLALARAREAFRAASWRAERECPEEWGPRSHITVENVTDLADKLRRAQERVIEHDPVNQSS